MRSTKEMNINRKEKRIFNKRESCFMMKSKNLIEKSQELLLNSFDETIAILRAIGHPNRFRILILLLTGPMTFQAFLDKMSLNKSALANHLTLLKSKSLVNKIQHGTYEITGDGRNYILAIEAAYRESETRVKNIREVKLRQELARTFLERR